METASFTRTQVSKLQTEAPKEKYATGDTSAETHHHDAVQYVRLGNQACYAKQEGYKLHGPLRRLLRMSAE